MTEDLQSRRIGINGVPFFVLNARFGLSGAQEPEAPLMILDLAREEDMQKGVA
jgi:predicted DsbA family dithiol-disulfide isomerase